MDELSFTLRNIHELQVPVTIIGCGSNILVKDGGIRGAVVSVRHMTQIMDCNDNVLCIGSGYMLKDASEFAWENGLSGLEFAIGIPGTLGGAVFMNAGAYDGEMSHVVTSVRCRLQGNIKEYDASHLDFGYRHSVFHDNHEVIGEVIMTLQPGDKDAIKARMDELTEKRESKQPLEYASAGSTFKRPPGYFAGTLIEQTGLKGYLLVMHKYLISMLALLSTLVMLKLKMYLILSKKYKNAYMINMVYIWSQKYV